MNKYGWLGCEKIREKNTRVLIAAVRKYPVKIVTHPGLRVDIDTHALSLVCRERGTALEINSNYTSESRKFLEKALQTEVKFAVSSDAHHPSQVGSFQRALSLIEEMGIPPARIINVE